MRTSVYLLLTALLLGGCSNGPVAVECSVDDTLVFVAPRADNWGVNAGTLMVYSHADGRLYRRMQENETCRAVAL
jgi:hypothetical protein